MTWAVSLLLAALLFLLSTYKLIVEPLYISPLSRIPGPKIYALSKWRLALDEWRGKRMQSIHTLHQKYGPVVRIGPREVHFNSPSAMRTIYGAGSGFERTDFYRMFDVYGKQNVFTFGPSHLHAERKKLLAHFYSKSNTVRGHVAADVESKVQDYIKIVEARLGEANEIFTTLKWYSLDNITNFLYGPEFGGTSAMKGNQEHRALLDDILDTARRQLSWCVVHLPNLMKWLYGRTGVVERIVSPLLPMKKPTTYTYIRAHALKAMQDFSAADKAGKVSAASQNSLICRLWAHHESRKNGGLGDLDIASECSDHFLAGIDTTSDTLMFLFWVLSLPQNQKYQEKLIEESRAIPDSGLNENGNPTVEVTDKLPYLDAVIKETLRLYAPIPASEPRQPPQDIQIDGYLIPAWTVVSMQPYSLHRNADIFPDPLRFDPDRWMGDSEQVNAMKRWWWAFSSGGRMCIGMHLALAEMALVPAIYRRYCTKIPAGFEGITPAISSRSEIFYDETFDKLQEHACWLEFVRQ